MTHKAGSVAPLLRIPAADGVKLGAHLYEPPSVQPVVANVVIHGATAVPQSFYQRFAMYLAERGYRTLTYDYRGIGQSRTGSLRGDPSTMRDWGELDVEAAFAFIRSLAKGSPIVGMGHSFGGQTIGLTDSWRGVDAAVLVASQLGYWRHWPSPTKWRHALTWYGAVPVVTAAFGYFPGWLGLGTDLPKGVARQWAQWCRHPDYLVGHIDKGHQRFRRFTAPTLLFSFTDDGYAPPASVDALAALLPARSLHHVRMSPDEAGRAVGHFGFFRPTAERTLWQAALAWIEHSLPRTTQAPSEERGSPRV